jgi:hypothetical protein
MTKSEFQHEYHSFETDSRETAQTAAREVNEKAKGFTVQPLELSFGGVSHYCLVLTEAVTCLFRTGVVPLNRLDYQ